MSYDEFNPYDPCEDCKAYGDDYVYDDDGELIYKCEECIHNSWLMGDDEEDEQSLRLIKK